MPAPIQVKCPHCSATLRFTPTGEVSTLKCPKCQQQMRIKTPGGAGPSPAGPGQRSRSPVSSTSPSVPAPSPDLDWNDIASPPPPGPVPSFQTNPANRSSSPGHFPHPGGPAGNKRKLGGGLVKPILIGCGAFAGLGVLGVGGLIAALFYLGTTAESKSTIALSGYSVDAPGKVMPESRAGAAVSVGIHHRRTNSEFGISVKSVAVPGQSFELETLLRLMQQQGTIVGPESPVSRAGLNGYHLTMRQPNGLKAQVEVYKINGQDILLLTYLSGKVKHDAGKGKLDRDPETIQKLDDPDAFFRSFRKG